MVDQKARKFLDKLRPRNPVDLVKSNSLAVWPIPNLDKPVETKWKSRFRETNKQLLVSELKVLRKKS